MLIQQIYRLGLQVFILSLVDWLQKSFHFQPFLYPHPLLKTLQLLLQRLLSSTFESQLWFKTLEVESSSWLSLIHKMWQKSWWASSQSSLQETLSLSLLYFSLNMPPPWDQPETASGMWKPILETLASSWPVTWLQTQAAQQRSTETSSDQLTSRITKKNKRLLL